MYFCKILQFDKFEGADFKYGNIYFQSLPQKYPNKAFLVANLGIFVFSEKFGIRQMLGCWFQIWQYSFKFYQKSHEIRHNWWQIYVLLFLFNFLQFDKFEGADFKHEDSYLKVYQKEIQITHFWSQIYAVLYFWKISQFQKFEGADLKYGNNYFQSLPEKYPNKAFLVANLGILFLFFFFFWKSLELDKFEGAVFKYGNTL